CHFVFSFPRPLRYSEGGSTPAISSPGLSSRFPVLPAAAGWTSWRRRRRAGPATPDAVEQEIATSTSHCLTILPRRPWRYRRNEIMDPGHVGGQEHVSREAIACGRSIITYYITTCNSTIALSSRRSCRNGGPWLWSHVVA